MSTSAMSFMSRLVAGGFFERVHVDPVAHLLHARANGARGVLQQVNFVQVERIGVHPDERGLKFRADAGAVVFVDQHVAAADVDFVFEGDVDRSARAGFFQFFLESDDRFDSGLHVPKAGRRRSLPARSTPEATCPAKPRKVASGRITYCTGKRSGPAAALSLTRKCLEIFEQRRPLEPGRARAAPNDVVAFERAHRNGVQASDAQLIGKFAKLGGDAFEDFLREADQIHFIDGGDDVLHAEQAGDEGVAARLAQNALGGVHQHHGGVGGGSAGGHVARVLLVAGSIGDDEFAARSREIAIGDVDGDALLAFGAQAIGEQGEIDRAARND